MCAAHPVDDVATDSGTDSGDDASAGVGPGIWPAPAARGISSLELGLGAAFGAGSVVLLGRVIGVAGFSLVWAFKSFWSACAAYSSGASVTVRPESASDTVI